MNGVHPGVHGTVDAVPTRRSRRRSGIDLVARSRGGARFRFVPFHPMVSIAPCESPEYIGGRRGRGGEGFEIGAREPVYVHVEFEVNPELPAHPRAVQLQES